MLVSNFLLHRWLVSTLSTAVIQNDLTHFTRCCVATLNSNLEVAIWTSQRNQLKGAWTLVCQARLIWNLFLMSDPQVQDVSEDVKEYLSTSIPKSESENVDRDTVVTLHAQVQCEEGLHRLVHILT